MKRRVSKFKLNTSTMRKSTLIGMFEGDAINEMISYREALARKQKPKIKQKWIANRISALENYIEHWNLLKKPENATMRELYKLSITAKSVGMAYETIEVLKTKQI